MNPKLRLIVFYLPQFYPIPENDKWWGKDFTEWTNVKKAKPLFRSHYQPRVPAELGYYDLRLAKVREAQAKLAKEYGIEGFCYWHYWFNGKRILERPFNEVIKSGKPDFPFCLAWANENWTGIWHNSPDKILIKQTYSGLEDYKAHFIVLLDAFKDKRYLTINGRKIFLVYNPEDLPEPKEFTDYWRILAKQSGLKGFYFIGFGDKKWDPKHHGFDALILHQPRFYDTLRDHLCKLLTDKTWWELTNSVFKRPRIYPYKKIIKYALPKIKNPTDYYPTMIPNWDNTPRCGIRGVVLHNSTPKFFKKQLKKAISLVVDREHEKRIIFIKSWNEWAEGNHLEPDKKFGRGYLEAIKETTTSKNHI